MTTIDALGYERQFIDHLAPVWRALPPPVRGTFFVEPSLVDYAATRGIIAAPRQRLDIARGRLVPPNTGVFQPALVASYGDTKEARRFGYGPLAFLEHGIGQSYGKQSDSVGSYSGGRDRDDTSLFLVPGPDPAERWRRAYPGARVEVVGCPRLDDLPRREPGPGPVVAVSFHWSASVSISGYAGTAIGEYAPALRDVAARWTTIAHAHPKADWQARARRTIARVAPSIEFIDSFDEVCRRADVYVCDNSSTIYEFAATERPVVLMNASHWHRNGPELGLRFWAASHVGVNVFRPSDLVGAIEEALFDSDNRQEARGHALSLVYGRRIGAARAAAAVVVDWLAEGARAAA